MSDEEQKEEKAADLKGTVGAFALLMKRKKSEQDATLGTEAQVTKLRQQNLLKAMVKIRRSLEEVSRLDLGDRFRFALEKDDFHGWPRLTIRLMDAFRPTAEYPIFQVVSHDRQNRAAIEIQYQPNAPVEFLSLSLDTEYKRLPLVLKKTVRTFLDTIGETMLEAERGSADEDHGEELVSVEDLLGPQTAAEPRKAPTEDINFFDDGYSGESEFDRLPELTDVQRLSLEAE